MNDESATNSLRRNVNIESAIEKSSFQIPVFVAISAADSEAQVIKTFATAREVFDHVFSILLDRLRQRHAVEAVEGLVPQSAHLTTSRDTEYVLLVRGKAIFWFSGAAAKRPAGRRLLLEHARDLAEAERAPFYVLNSRPKKIRAALIATGLVIIIPAGFLLTPFAIDWARKLARHQTVSTPHPLDSVNSKSDQQKPLIGSDVQADYAGTDGSVEQSPATRIASLHSQSKAADQKPVAPEDRGKISNYAARMANFARAWPDQFDDRLLFAYPNFTEQTEVPASLSSRPGNPKPPPSPNVGERRAIVPNLGMADRTPVLAKSTT